MERSGRRSKASAKKHQVFEWTRLEEGSGAAPVFLAARFQILEANWHFDLLQVWRFTLGGTITASRSCRPHRFRTGLHPPRGPRQCPSEERPLGHLWRLPPTLRDHLLQGAELLPGESATFPTAGHYLSNFFARGHVVDGFARGNAKSDRRDDRQSTSPSSCPSGTSLDPWRSRSRSLTQPRNPRFLPPHPTQDRMAASQTGSRGRRPRSSGCRPKHTRCCLACTPRRSGEDHTEHVRSPPGHRWAADRH